MKISNRKNNKRGPKSKRTDGKFVEIKKNVSARQLQHALRYIVQHSDSFMWNVLDDKRIKESTIADLWHAYGLRHACDLLIKFIYDKDSDYRNDLTQIRRTNETINTTGDNTSGVQFHTEATSPT